VTQDKLSRQLGDRDHEDKIEEQLQPRRVPLALLTHGEQTRTDNPRLVAWRATAVMSGPPPDSDTHPAESTPAACRHRPASLPPGSSRLPDDGAQAVTTRWPKEPAGWRFPYGCSRRPRADCGAGGHRCIPDARHPAPAWSALSRWVMPFSRQIRSNNTSIGTPG